MIYTIISNRYTEIILYLLFGGMTVLISVISFGFFYNIFNLTELVANAISWCIAVVFAFITNQKWVFKANTKEMNILKMQIIAFFAGRLFTFALEEVILFIFITQYKWDGIFVKSIAQIMVIMINYVVSKVWVFKKKVEE